MKYVRFSLLLLIFLPGLFFLRVAPADTDSSAARDFRLDQDESDLIGERVRLYLLRHGDNGKIDPERRLERIKQEYAARQAEEASRKLSPEAVAGTDWVSIGPANGAGRATGIAIHPTTGGTFYIGAAGGGVWKTTDDGGSWVPLTESINDLSVGAVALDPSAPDTLYVGTGEGGLAADFIPGIGFLKSSDGGNTWIFPTSVIATQFYRISVHPTNGGELIAGCNRGALRSTNGGDSWTTVVDPAVYGDVTDIVRDPTSPQTLYATTWDRLRWCARGNCALLSPRVLKSTDGGVTWVDKSNGLPRSSSKERVNRMSIAISPSNPAVLYLVVAIMDADTGNEPSHIFKSTDSGNTWADLPTVSESSNSNVSHFLAAQAWYNTTIVVNPTNENLAIAGGTLYVRTTDGGNTWDVAPFMFTRTSAHVDVHDLRYEGSNLIMANDGGVWSSPDNGTTSIEHNAGLVTRQYYAMTNDPMNRNRVLAGAQDNGTTRRPDTGGDQWAAVIGGDGFQCAVSSGVPSLAFGTVQNGLIFRAKDAGTNPAPRFINITPPYSTNEQGSFFSVVRADPNNPPVIYTATYRLWRSSNGGDTWVAMPTATTDGSTWPPNSLITDIAIAQSNSSVLMVNKGTDVFRSTDGGMTWSRKSGGLPSNRFVNNVEIDPANPLVAYAAFAGTTSPNIYQSTDGGTSWAPRGAGLPNFSAQVIRVDPTDSTVLYCGTDVGVYRSTDRGGSWSKFGNGLPSSSVHDLQILTDGSILRVATHGRGVWELQVPPTGNTPPTATISSPAADMRITTGTTVNFSGSVSDPDSGDSATAVWIFPDTWESVSTAGGATSASHTFNQPGVFPVTLVARDSHGALRSAKVVVTVPEAADSCATPIVVPGSGPFPFTVTTSNETAGTQQSDPVPACVSQGLGRAGSLWFEFTPAASGQYEFTTCGSSVSLVLSLWTGPPCGPYTAVAGGCNHNAAQGSPCFRSRTSDLILHADAGQTLRLMVGGNGGSDIGTFLITVDLLKPTITQATIEGKNLIVTGRNFSEGAVIALNGVDQKTRNDDQNPTTTLVGKKVAKQLAAGQMVSLQVRNGDGTLSNVFSFTR